MSFKFALFKKADRFSKLYGASMNCDQQPSIKGEGNTLLQNLFAPKNI